MLTAAHCILVDEAESDPLLKPEFAQQRDAVTVSRSRQVSLSRCVSAALVIDGFRVRLGADDISGDDGISFRIDCAVVHRGWTPADMYHDDIALVHFTAAGWSLGYSDTDGARASEHEVAGCAEKTRGAAHAQPAEHLRGARRRRALVRAKESIANHRVPMCGKEERAARNGEFDQFHSWLIWGSSGPISRIVAKVDGI